MNTPFLPLIRWLAARFFIVILFAAAVPPLAAADDAKAHDELRQLLAVYEKAINSGDLAPLESFFSPESSGVVVDNQPFKNFVELKAIYDRFHASFPGTVYHIKMDAEPSQIIGDLAVAHGTCDEFVKMGAGEFAYKSHWTAVLKRENGQWKLVRSQFTMDPFRSTIVQYFVRQTKLYAGLGGLAAGLVIGFIAARVLGKKQVVRV